MIALDIQPEKLFRLKWTKYIPHQPTAKQRLFLALPQEEAFYGGAAGGGKSDALLMAALQYVDCPGYSAILFRRTFTDLSLPDALIARSHEWLAGTDARWHGQSHSWSFPSGARVVFGYLDTERDKYRYQSAQFAYVAFDELTQFPRDNYLYLHSRLRRLVDARFPARVRSASNPGGEGHLWVKERFCIKPRVLADGTIAYLGHDLSRPYIPAWISDNPHIAQAEYEQRLEVLDPVTREQLRRGDWGVSADGRFRASWVKRYSQRGRYYVLGPDGHGEAIQKPTEVEVFTVCDTATSKKEIHPTKATGASRSATVIGTFARTLHENHLLVLNITRLWDEFPAVVRAIRSDYREWRPEYVAIENATGGSGPAYIQELERQGLPVRALNPGTKDKLVRSADAQNRMSRGKIWLPQTASWLHDFESEIFTWTGLDGEPNDQVDVLSYAAKEVSNVASGYEQEESQYTRSMPAAVGVYAGPGP